MQQETSTFQFLTLHLFSYPKMTLWKCRIVAGLSRVFGKERVWVLPPSWCNCLHLFLRDFHSNWCLRPSCNPRLLLTANCHPQQSIFAEEKSWIWSKEEWPNRTPRLQQFTIQYSGTFVCYRGAYNHIFFSSSFHEHPLSIWSFTQERD